MSSEEMSREEKEALLNIRMEQIRKKNAELQKRYEEVKADKQNAEEISDTFKITRRNVTAEPLVRRTPPREKVDRPREKARYSEGRTPQRQAPEVQEKKRPQRLTEDDGPPPDPSYSFLADRSREGNSSSAQDRRRDSRRHQGNFGGKDFDNVKSTMEHRRGYDKSSPRQPPQSKMEMSMRMTGRERCEYERWRSERTKIEHDRIDRQRTTSGEWKREWDREKHASNEPEEGAPPKHWGSRKEPEEGTPRNRWGSRKEPEDSESHNRWGSRKEPEEGEPHNRWGSRKEPVEGEPHNRWGPRNRGGSRSGRGGRGARGSRQWNDQQWQRNPKSAESDETPTPRESQPHSRNIQLDNENINVSFSNDPVASDNRNWRTYSDRQSTSSREYSSSVSEDERPSPGQHSSMQWCDMVKSSKNKKPPIAEDSVFESKDQPQRDNMSATLEPREATPEGAIEQRVVFVDTGIQNLQETRQQPPSLQADGDDIQDDASWDDEGSWEEATSGNESQGLSQHSQDIPETVLPSTANDSSEAVAVASATSPQRGSSTLVADTTTSAQSDSREATPVAEVQYVLNAESESNVCDTIRGDKGETDVFEATAEDDNQQHVEVFHLPAESQQAAESTPISTESSQPSVQFSQEVREFQQATQSSLNTEESSLKVEGLSLKTEQYSLKDEEMSLKTEQSSIKDEESSIKTEDSFQKSVELSYPSAEASHPPVNSSQYQEDFPQQPVESETIVVSSQQPREADEITESSQQPAELQQPAESPDQYPDGSHDSKKKCDEYVVPDESLSIEPQNEGQTEVNQCSKDVTAATEEAEEMNEAMSDSIVTREDEAKAAQETADVVMPVPSGTEASPAGTP